MSVFSYSYYQASENFRTGEFARWNAAEEKRDGKTMMPERMADGVFRPGLNCHTPIKATDKIFTIGSCFARGVERALHRAGMNVASLPQKRFLSDVTKAGFVNRYHTASILSELRWAAGEPYGDELFLEVHPNLFVDPHSHHVARSASLDQARQRRSLLTAYFKQMFSVDVVTITLGLIEAWFDKSTGLYINFNPINGADLGARRAVVVGDRFEFRVMSHDENMQYLEDIYTLLKKHNPEINIIVTVSPVPLSATFSHRDVAVANMLSKSMLRSCAETWISRHPDIQYFPSYEMVMLSDRARAFREDAVHIQESFVDEIMGHFINGFVQTPPTRRRPMISESASK